MVLNRHRFTILSTLFSATIVLHTCPANGDDNHCPNDVPATKGIHGDFQFDNYDVYYESRYYPKSSGDKYFYYCIDASETGRGLQVKWGIQSSPLFSKYIPRKAKARNYEFGSVEDNGNQDLKYGKDDNHLDDTISPTTYYDDGYASAGSAQVQRLVSWKPAFVSSKDLYGRMSSFEFDLDRGPLTEILSDENLKYPAQLEDSLKNILNDGEAVGYSYGGDYFIPATNSVLSAFETRNIPTDLDPSRDFVKIEVKVWSGIEKIGGALNIRSEIFVWVPMEKDGLNVKLFSTQDSFDSINLESISSGRTKFSENLGKLLSIDEPNSSVKISSRPLDKQSIGKERGLLIIKGPDGYEFGSLRYLIFE
jgi:hypothetical protein